VNYLLVSARCEPFSRDTEVPVPETPQTLTLDEIAAAMECRSSPRYRILQRCVVRPVSAPGPEGWHCIAYNVSTEGLGLTLPLRLPPGTLLEVRPYGLPPAPVVLARVVHSALVEFAWFTGCRLNEPLSDQQLQAWCSGPLTWVDESR
jgi:hypothetical protein